jgi:hypothetical protein
VRFKETKHRGNRHNAPSEFLPCSEY